MLKKLVLSTMVMFALTTAAEARTVFVYQQVVAPRYQPFLGYGYHAAYHPPVFARTVYPQQCRWHGHGRGHGHERHEWRHTGPHRGYW